MSELPTSGDDGDDGDDDGDGDDWQVFIRNLGIQLITGPKEMQSPERFYDYAIYNGEQVHFSIWYNLVAQNF